MQRSGSTGRVLGAALALLTALVPAARAAEVPLVATLAPGDAPGELRFRLTNTGARALAVLPANTPLEAELSADVFRLIPATADRGEAERAPYRGRRVKRVAPAPGDFVTLAPGGSVTATVPLGRYYAVPLAGDYDVTYAGEVEFVEAGALAAGALRHVHLETHGPRLFLDPDAAEPRARPAVFARCDTRRRAALDETTAAAERLVADALAALDAHAGATLASAPRYTRWFGPWRAARERRVRRTFAALADALGGATLSYDCGCDDPTLYAFVYPSRLHDVFVCPAFFRAPLLGRDSRAGTLVHELSHFSAIAGTVDHAYGSVDAASLARADADRAVGNADSYEYFAENEPFLPMAGGTPLLDPEPPSDDASPPFAPLPLDAVLSGTLAAGELDRFVTSGAGAVAVDSLAGDADLYVFADPALAALACASTTLARSGAPEHCPIADERTVYVVVHAHTDTRYTIRASAASPASIGAAPLPPPREAAPEALPAPRDDAPPVPTGPVVSADATGIDDGGAGGGRDVGDSGDVGIGGGGAGGGGATAPAVLLLLGGLRLARRRLDARDARSCVQSVPTGMSS